MLAEQRQRLPDAAAGLEQLGLFGNRDARGVSGAETAFAEMGDDLLGSVMRIDDDRIDAGGDQTIDCMIEKGAAANAHEGLRHAVGDRPHPFAEAGGQHHSRDGRAHALLRGVGRPRRAGGMWRRSQSATGARAGWRRSCSMSRQTRGMC